MYWPLFLSWPLGEHIIMYNKGVNSTPASNKFATLKSSQEVIKLVLRLSLNGQIKLQKLFFQGYVLGIT